MHLETCQFRMIKYTTNSGVNFYPYNFATTTPIRVSPCGSRTVNRTSREGRKVWIFYHRVYIQNFWNRLDNISQPCVHIVYLGWTPFLANSTIFFVVVFVVLSWIPFLANSTFWLLLLFLSHSSPLVPTTWLDSGRSDLSFGVEKGVAHPPPKELHGVISHSPRRRAYVLWMGPNHKSPRIGSVGYRKNQITKSTS